MADRVWMDEREQAVGDRLLRALRTRARDFDLDVEEGELLGMLEAELEERNGNGDRRKLEAVRALRRHLAPGVEIR